MNRRHPLPVLLPALAGLGLAAGAQDLTPHRMANEVAGHQYEYLLRLPAGIPEGGAPLLLFLHGSGERGDKIDRVKVHGPPKLAGRMKALDPFVIVAPQCPAGQWWKTESLKALLDEVIAAHPEAVDQRRMVVTGLSMGGYGTWNLVSKHPDLFAAAVPICGGGDLSRLRKRFKIEETWNPEDILRATHLPIRVFHGGADGVVPARASQTLVDTLREAGAQRIEITVYPGVGHDSWTRTYADPNLYKWMLKQRRAEPSDAPEEPAPEASERSP